jgi:hypothetical protein
MRRSRYVVYAVISPMAARASALAWAIPPTRNDLTAAMSEGLPVGERTFLRLVHDSTKRSDGNAVVQTAGQMPPDPTLSTA